MDLLSILRILRQRLWVLITFPLISVICAGFFISRMDKVYKSTAQMATGFTSDETVTLSEEKTSNQFEVNTKFINTIESMKSLPVMTLVSYRLILHDLESETPFRQVTPEDGLEFEMTDEVKIKAKAIFQDHLTHFKTLNSTNPDDQLAYAILKAYKYDADFLSESISISRRTTSDFIMVEYESENAFLSAFTVNSLCEEFIRFNKALKTDRSSESVEFLENQVEEKRRLKDEKTAELSNFKVSNNVVNYGAESESKIMQISDYEANKEIEEKKISGLELSLATIKSKIQSYKKLDKEEIARINQRIIELRRKINELSTTDNQTNQAKIEQLRDELQLETSRLEMMSQSDDSKALTTLMDEQSRLELELQIAKSNLQAIDISLRRLKYDVSGFATKEARLTDLERELEAASKDYEKAVDKYNAAKSKASVIGSSLRQILQGQPSDEPEPSKALLLIALAGIGSLVLCSLVILGLDFANFSIRNQNRLEAMTGLKNIAALNAVELKTLEIEKIFDERNQKKSSDVFVHFMRKFRFEIRHAENQILLVTSTKANVGKTFIIISLAYTLSLLNKRILIIDTNFKNNSLTRLLLPNNTNVKLLRKGMVSDPLLLQETNGPFIAGEEAQESSKSEQEADTKETDNIPSAHKDKSIIYKTRYSGIDIIGNFGGKHSPSEIMADKDFKGMLNNLAYKYDYVILEGAALNDFSDSKELIEYADVVIPVFDADAVLGNLDYDSIKYLKSLKGKVPGTVLNRVNLKELAV